MKTIFTTLTLLSFSAIGFSQLNEIDAPVENFEKLWKEFDNKYANFELKEVDCSPAILFKK